MYTSAANIWKSLEIFTSKALCISLEEEVPYPCGPSNRTLIPFMFWKSLSEDYLIFFPFFEDKEKTLLAE